MQSERFNIRYITVNNCFLYLPDVWLRKLKSKPNIVRVTYQNNSYYLSWSPSPSPHDSPALSATFARSLGINEGEEITISCVSEPPSLSSITVTPNNIQDQEILELQCDKVQSTLLDQISIVAKSQPIVVWISKRLSIVISVDSLNPDFLYGKLNEHSEVHVKNAVLGTGIKRNRGSSGIQNTTTIGYEISRIFKHVPLVFGEKSDCSRLENAFIDIQSDLDKYIDKEPPQVYRVHEVLKIENASHLNAQELSLRCPYNAFVGRSNLPISFNFSRSNLFKIRKVSENQEYINTSSTNFLRRKEDILKESTELIVKLVCLEDCLDRCSSFIDRKYFVINSRHKIIYVSSNLILNLKVQVGGKIILEPYEIPDSDIHSVKLFPFNASINCEIFKDFIGEISKHEKLLLNSSAKIVLNNGEMCLLKFSPDCRCAHFDIKYLKNLKVIVNDVKDREGKCEEASVEKEELWLEKVLMRVFDRIIEECKIILYLSLDLHNIKHLEYVRENILICGDLGSGKSTICKILRHQLRKPASFFIHTHTIECKPLKGKKMEIIQKVIQATMADCVYHQYSVIFLDDLDCIASLPMNDEEKTPDSMNAMRIMDMILHLFLRYQAVHYVSLIATCTNINKIGHKLRVPKGTHFFRSILSIPALEKEDRIEILQLNFKNKLTVSSEVEWNDCGNKTEGWVAQDLVDMAEKAAFTAWKRHIRDRLGSPVTLSEEDLSSTLVRSKPMSLQDIQLYKGPGHSWSDIGGLTKVKKILIEILHWPLRFPEIFKNAPIKLQSGVLLYGMPGTGKTMLAGAIAKECGLNMISVKGPELLSKYIGASEELVRNTFEKARRAKPCILFFDEFDSLAPKRGHDNTGVTDRVVNQLLTQLDGIEGREGVAIVAATSRPDLLDPALLRPGRLDKLLLCSLPDQDEREEILETLCKSHRVDTTNLNLRDLAILSPGFTGADLNSVLTTARLTALENALGRASKEERKNIDGRSIIQEELLDALKSTRPSLTIEEKNKYNYIYNRFSGGGDSRSEIIMHQKATLA